KEQPRVEPVPGTELRRGLDRLDLVLGGDLFADPAGVGDLAADDFQRVDQPGGGVGPDDPLAVDVAMTADFLDGGGGQVGRDEVEGDDDQHHEHDRLKRVGPRGAPHAAEEHVDQYDQADHQFGEPGGDAAGLGQAGEVAAGGAFDRLAGGDDSHQQVGDDQSDEDGEQHQADLVA